MLTSQLDKREIQCFIRRSHFWNAAGSESTSPCCVLRMGGLRISYSWGFVKGSANSETAAWEVDGALMEPEFQQLPVIVG